MGKSARKLFSTIYENDVIDLDTLNELENVVPLKTNRAIKKATKHKEPPPAHTQSTKPTITTKPVEATCNKCSNKVVGELIADLYIQTIDKMMPLISYTCKSCGHVGRRSVMSLALPLDMYEKKFFN